MWTENQNKKLKAKQKTKEKRKKKRKKIVVEQIQIQQTCFYCLFRLRPYLHTYSDIFQSGDFSSQFSQKRYASTLRNAIEKLTGHALYDDCMRSSTKTISPRFQKSPLKRVVLKRCVFSVTVYTRYVHVDGRKEISVFEENRICETRLILVRSILSRCKNLPIVSQGVVLD